jgi:UDP-glucuronate 4-epimerase
MKILLTGVAGFIGMHVAKQLLARGEIVIGIDSLNDYYDVGLKKARLNTLIEHPNFYFYKEDISDRRLVENVFLKEKPRRVIHLAAQAGVRYSLTNPHAYIDANLQGFINILEGCRHQSIEHLVYASSSSVYGGNTKLPFSEHDNVDHPVSLYAATKKANELIAHTYSHLYKLPTTGLRFFTVYGPWGRPDMAPFLFTKAILEGRPIDIYNHGKMSRDFTYIDDIVTGVLRVLDKPAGVNNLFDSENPDPASSNAPYRIFNIGNSQTVPLMHFISELEQALGLKARKNFKEMQAGDVTSTAADTRELEDWIGFKPNTTLSIGIANFVMWYRSFYA